MVLRGIAKFREVVVEAEAVERQTLTVQGVGMEVLVVAEVEAAPQLRGLLA
jgi:hypothetical protein